MSKTHYLSLFPNSSGNILPDVNNVGRLFYKTGSDEALYVCSPTGWQKVTNTNISIRWEDITNKPATQPPSPHIHQITDITGLTELLASKAPISDLSGKEDKSNRGVANGYAPLNSLSIIPSGFLGTGLASSATYLRGDGTWGTIVLPTGTVSNFEVSSQDGVITSLTNATTVPNLSISLGNITPDSVNTPSILHSSGISFGAANKTQFIVNSVETSFYTGIREGVATVNSSTAYTVDLINGTIFDITLTANCVYTFPNATTSKGKQFTIFQRQGSTPRSVTWPTTVRWSGGTAPTITASASKMDVLSFVCDGARWLGFVSGLNYDIT